MEITIDFNGNLHHLSGVITQLLYGECHWNLHRYTLKHYFYKKNIVKFAKCVFLGITFKKVGMFRCTLHEHFYVIVEHLLKL